MFARLVLMACAMAVVSAGPASFIKKCHAGDAKCHKESTQAALPIFASGIPELGIQRLDPLVYDSMNASTKDLLLILKDLTISGISNCQIKKMTRDNQNTKFLIRGICTLNLEGQYEIGGKLIFLPIEGKGKIRALLNKVMVSVEANVAEKIGKDGKKHWDIKSWKHAYELMDKSEIDLENLFQGNEVLGRATKELLKASPNEVIAEVAPPVIKALLTKIVKVVDKFVSEVPVEDLSLD